MGNREWFPATQFLGLQGARNALLANHQEMQQHKDGDRPGKNEGMQAVEAGQRGLSDAGTAPHQLDDRATDDGNGFGNATDDLNGPVSHLIPG